MSEDLITAVPMLQLEVIDRPSVRVLATEYHEYLGRASAAGHNVHQIALDWHDKLAAYMGSLSDADAQRFGQLYAEETTALTQETIAKIADL
nr:hypothetical protein [Tanacetum cinerariifolium]